MDTGNIEKSLNKYLSKFLMQIKFYLISNIITFNFMRKMVLMKKKKNIPLH